jgi:hypothetical protein
MSERVIPIRWLMLLFHSLHYVLYLSVSCLESSELPYARLRPTEESITYVFGGHYYVFWSRQPFYLASTQASCIPAYRVSKQKKKNC